MIRHLRGQFIELRCDDCGETVVSRSLMGALRSFDAGWREWETGETFTRYGNPQFCEKTIESKTIDVCPDCYKKRTVAKQEHLKYLERMEAKDDVR